MTTSGSPDRSLPRQHRLGRHAVALRHACRLERIAFNPNYTYNPKINFQQGENDKVLTIAAGAERPGRHDLDRAVDKPTYGIHGTPEPSKIGKTQSHGCVRLTNWDATELAKMTSKGVTVEFVD